MDPRSFACPLLALLAACASTPAPEDDIRAVAALDTVYQAAVERNDAETMATILHEDMIVVLGNGKAYTRGDLLDSARTRHILYERQVEDPGTQTVRLYGRDTAIITARLWLKGTSAEGEAMERRLWFSDTYVRTPQGWKYAFGQASLALPPEE
ncbi:MAG: nuclear transport factor 2 family protein [Acidobacteria bacterium]|nr:nuclear transport factor 2 family protein [Acidobacteriota bacterium]